MICSEFCERIKWSFDVSMQARDATVSMPMRIQRIDELLQQLEAGDLKLRVRVLEVHAYLYCLNVKHAVKTTMLVQQGL